MLLFLVMGYKTKTFKTSTEINVKKCNLFYHFFVQLENVLVFLVC